MPAPAPQQNEGYQKIYAKRRGFFFRADYRYRRLWLREILGRHGIRLEGKKVLDVSFGSGNLLFSLPRSVGIFGVEQAESAVEQARAMAKESGYRDYGFKTFSAAEGVPYGNGLFDFVFCSHVLEHVPDDSRLLQEIHRVLKPNGLLFLILPVEKEGENPRHLRVYRSGDVQNLIQDRFELTKEENSYHHARLMLPLIRVHTKWRVPVLGILCDVLHHLLLRILPYRAGRFLDRVLERLGVAPSQTLYLCRASAGR